MRSPETFGAVTSPVLGYSWTGEAARVRRTVPPVRKVEGTGLPFAGFGTSGVTVLGMGADQVQRSVVIRIPADADPGIPPRRGPVRC